MYVDIDTLNALGLTIEDREEERIALLVSIHERDYLDLCLSVPLSVALTDTTKDDERFTNLSNVGTLEVDGITIRTKGIAAGANYYIYYHYLLQKFQDVSSSGVTVQLPENSKQLDPERYLISLNNYATDASRECITAIELDEDTYPEYDYSDGLDKMYFF